MKINPTELHNFAKQFTKDQWVYLCTSQDFLALILEDLAKARLLANKLLKLENADKKAQGKEQ
jgi:hypothetical protein